MKLNSPPRRIRKILKSLHVVKMGYVTVYALKPDPIRLERILNVIDHTIKEIDKLDKRKLESVLMAIIFAIVGNSQATIIALTLDLPIPKLKKGGEIASVGELSDESIIVQQKSVPLKGVIISDELRHLIINGEFSSLTIGDDNDVKK